MYKPLTRLIHIETGMNVDDFTKLLGVSRKKIDRVDAIHTRVGLLRNIAKHFNMTVDELIDVLESENGSSMNIGGTAQDEIQQKSRH